MYRNHEGYSDPTAGVAIENISREEHRKKRMHHINQNRTVSIHPKTTVSRKKARRHYNKRVEDAKWIKAITSAQNKFMYQEAGNDL